MSRTKDGIIKYDNSNFVLSDPIPLEEFTKLEHWRSKFYQLKLVGEYKIEKVGYGNLSQRKDYSQYKQIVKGKAQFIITGSQTGGLKNLSGEHYTRVIDYDLSDGLIWAVGPIKASSESMSHAAVYEANPQIEAVFHIHSIEIWKKLIEREIPLQDKSKNEGGIKIDFTPKEVEYGSLEMAQTVKEAVGNKSSGIIVMKGHEEGILSYGKSLNQAGELILDLCGRH